MLVTRATASPVERLIGGPLRHEHDARFSVKLDEDIAARLLSAVRISASDFHSPNAGHSSSVGMTWHASDTLALDMLSVVARPSEYGTSVSVVIDRRWTFVLTGIVSSLAVFMAFVAGIGLYDAIPLLAPWIPVAGIGGALAVARRVWASSTKKAREQIGMVMDSIGQTVVQPENRVGNDAVSPARDAAVVGDTELTGA
jgi:hypothetical protein